MEKKPFIAVDYAAIMDGGLTAQEIAVYVVLCAFAGGAQRVCFPSYATIAEKAGCCRSTAIRAVARLAGLGLVRKQARASGKGDPSSNLYTLSNAPVSQDSPARASQTPPPVRPVHRPSAPRTPELSLLKQIQSVNHSSSSAGRRGMRTEDDGLGNQIEYRYFRESMPARLPIVDCLMEAVRALRREDAPSLRPLLADIDSCTVLDFIAELDGVNLSQVRCFSAWLKRVFAEFLRKRAVELSALSG